MRGDTQLEDRIDVGGEILFRRDHRLGAGAERGDRIDQEAVRGVDRLVAIAEEGARDQVEQVVGAGAADDAVGVESEHAPNRLAQGRSRAVRIILQVLGDRLVRGNRRLARA